MGFLKFYLKNGSGRLSVIITMGCESQWDFFSNVRRYVCKIFSVNLTVTSGIIICQSVIIILINKNMQ